MGDGVGTVGVIHHHTRRMGAVDHLDMGHVDSLTEVEIETHFERTDDVLDEVFTCAIPNCRTVYKGNVVERNIHNIDERESCVHS